MQVQKHIYFLEFLKNSLEFLKKFLKYYSFKMTWTTSFYYVFLYLTCFILSTYAIFIRVCWFLMAYASSKTHLFIRLQKTFSSCDPEREWPHAGLYNYSGRQIELLQMKCFNRLLQNNYRWLLPLFR